MLKECSTIVAVSVWLILNASFNQEHVPKLWKRANMCPIPKTIPVLDINKDLRPESLTSTVSKVAEEFIVERYVKPLALEVLHDDQYGAIPGSSSTHALIGMIHHFANDTDGSGGTVRTLLCDFAKAFDLDDRRILLEKLINYRLPSNIVNWLLIF